MKALSTLFQEKALHLRSVSVEFKSFISASDGQMQVKKTYIIIIGCVYW